MAIPSDKKPRRLRNVTVDEVSLVDRPAVHKFALWKRDGTADRPIANMSDHDAAIVNATFDAQDAEVKQDVLKQLTALTLATAKLGGNAGRVDVLALAKKIEGAFIELGKRSPKDYVDLYYHPHDYAVLEAADGSFVISKKASAAGIAERDGRVFVVGEDGRGAWVPKVRR